jgi:hypothetical protein
MELGSTYVPNKYVRTKESMFIPNAYYLKQYKIKDSASQI